MCRSAKLERRSAKLAPGLVAVVATAAKPVVATAAKSVVATAAKSVVATAAKPMVAVLVVVVYATSMVPPHWSVNQCGCCVFPTVGL